jgi:preprotein translocase subunit SecE
MAKREEDEKDDDKDDERDDESGSAGEDPSAESSDEADEDEGEEEDEEEEVEPAAAAKKQVVDAEYEEEDEDASEGDEDVEGEDKAARTALDTAPASAEGEEDGVPPTQLGANKYVYSAFFSAGLLLAYILGRSIHGIWALLSNRDFFALRFPWATSIHDDTKMTYSMIAGGLIALVIAFRSIKRAGLRQWADEVAGELVKVKWPTKKEVQNSTIVVIATSAVAVTYMFLLDRFFGFVTDRIYSLGG